MRKQLYSNKSKIHIVYKTKDGNRVPGVTTITNEIAKPALIHWAWSLGIKGVDYRIHRDELADIGTLTHSMILCHLKKEEFDTSEYSKMQIDKAENCFLSYLEWERQHKIKPIIIEIPLISELWKYGGRPDFFGEIDGTKTLMDFKTGKAIYEDYWYQIAGYRQLLIENEFQPEAFRILNIGRDENEKFNDVLRQDLKLETDIFFAALQIYKAKKEVRRRKA